MRWKVSRMVSICEFSYYEVAADERETKIKNRLQNKVIDLEVAAETSSPTVDPSVRTILIGHSMG